MEKEFGKLECERLGGEGKPRVPKRVILKGVYSSADAQTRRKECGTRKGGTHWGEPQQGLIREVKNKKDKKRVATNLGGGGPKTMRRDWAALEKGVRDKENIDLVNKR